MVVEWVLAVVNRDGPARVSVFLGPGRVGVEKPNAALEASACVTCPERLDERVRVVSHPIHL